MWNSLEPGLGQLLDALIMIGPLSLHFTVLFTRFPSPQVQGQLKSWLVPLSSIPGCLHPSLTLLVGTWTPP